MPEIDAVAVHPHTATGNTAALHDAEVNEICRILHQHDVARVAQRLRGQIEKLLRAMGNNRTTGLVRRRLTAEVPVELPDATGCKLPERGVASCRAVLKRRLAKRGVTQHFVKQSPAPRHRQRRVVGETGRQRDQSWPLELDSHQPRDRWLRSTPPHRR